MAQARIFPAFTSGEKGKYLMKPPEWEKTHNCKISLTLDIIIFAVTNEIFLCKLSIINESFGSIWAINLLSS